MAKGYWVIKLTLGAISPSRDVPVKLLVAPLGGRESYFPDTHSLRRLLSRHLQPALLDMWWIILSLALSLAHSPPHRFVVYFMCVFFIKKRDYRCLCLTLGMANGRLSLLHLRGRERERERASWPTPKRQERLRHCAEEKSGKFEVIVEYLNIFC